MYKGNVLRHLKSWKETFRRKFEVEAKFRSLSPSDQDKVCDAFQTWVSICFDICSTRTSSDAAMAFFSNLKSVVKAGEQISYKEAISDCDALDGVLLSRGQISKKDARHCLRAGWLRKLVYHFCDYPFRDVHQLLSFMKRLTIASDEDLESVAKVSYHDNLERVRKCVPSQVDLDKVHRVVQRWASTFVQPSADDLSFGNGQVFQKLRSKSRMRKFANLSPTTRSSYLWKRLDPEIDLDRLLFEKIPFSKKRDGNLKSPCSAWQVVPKSYKTYRSICMEDLELSLFQHAGFQAFRRWFSTIPGNPVDLEDQERSAALARLGSIAPDTYATIDLSMASDSVSLQLATALFWDTPLRFCLFGMRSATAWSDDGERIDLPLLASMGSALCFPAECVVFAAIVQSVVDEHYPSDLNQIAPFWCVYGDDIVCETWLAPAIIDRLQKLGFLVNTTKSYYTETSYFREACGGEFFHGEDVTPFRIPRNFESLGDIVDPKKPLSGLKTGNLECYYSMCNELFAHGFFYARLIMIDNLCKRVPREWLPWSNNIECIRQPTGAPDAWGIRTIASSSALYTCSPVRPDRWDSRLQVGYRRTISSKTFREEKYYSVRGHLLSSLCKRSHEDPGNAVANWVTRAPIVSAKDASDYLGYGYRQVFRDLGKVGAVLLQHDYECGEMPLPSTEGVWTGDTRTRYCLTRQYQ